jgi:hypothetical protein
MKLSYQDLLNRLTDLKALSIPPAPGERSGCFSSFDRRSRYIAEEDRYVEWDANVDGEGYIRKLDDGSIVAAELEGPGVIWRSWSAMPDTGNVRIYIDGELNVDTPFIRYFTGFGSDFAPANTPNVCPHISRGYNSFIPVPFQKSIRIELSPGWGAYYHFTYTVFPEGTIMPSNRDLFTRPGRIALAALDRRLHLRGMHIFTPSTSALVGANKSETLFCLAGQGGITRFQLRLADPAFAKHLILKMYWDGDLQPSVCTPVCDFFGASIEMNPFCTWQSGLTGGVLYARWYMPYSKGARIELQNLGKETAKAEALIETENCPEAPSLLRFHSKWHRDHFDGLDRAQFEPGGQRFPDWPVLNISGGSGRFCGIHLRILDKWIYPGGMKKDEWWFGYDGCERLDWWWGEGDEKFFVDGEKFPSTFGTGSEDYIGYAWAAEPPFALFDSPFAAMSAMPLDGNGVTSVCRFHICDNVPFQQAFEACIEKYKGNEWGNGNRCLYGATAFWYQVAGVRDGYRMPTAVELEEME